MILLDTHATLNFGTRGCFKSVQAARAAALAAWLVTQAGEQAGLSVYGDNALLLKPDKGHRGALALCGALASLDRHNAPQSLAASLKQVRQLPARPSRLLLISDGFHLSQDDLTTLAVINRRSPLLLLGVADVLEAALPVAGHYAVSLAGKHIPLPLFGRQREAFFQQLNQGQQCLQQFARQQGLRYCQLTTQDDPLAAVNTLLNGTGNEKRR
jgi:uncharacterized protein (DUF58 family)